ncbi:hypothetical protein COS91_02210 [Candidatus Desantisbacteria bacterium CG07_land_8_20_14_0_80_39_15]|uniref:Cytotoxin n=2 Tax=unclassified Candidatus Desantisiibacteriota TaxID=3106372 RepID=A0A2H9PCB7_9BACT|nr:MAG: hypothetical protein COS91_02210 [Candidatus Desantisbacteria bacterium CG07_land_8_20_14_0_80_39_15]PIZ16832.1 MAG: hypothetical protein COY51_01875 [Candidatus Desantisbacteria bacterium CG_4_10_14_0_8_um_filter_39_17]
MISRNFIIPKSIQKKLKKFPKEIRAKFYWALGILLKNPSYPSLRHKKIESSEDLWEFSITMNYRAVYKLLNENTVLITNIGTHDIL